MHGSRWLALLVPVLLDGCFEPGVYACAGEGSCDAGTCEPTGFCSYPDDACASGRRYSALAGDGLAGACVDVPPPSTTSSTGATTSTAGSSDDETTTPQREPDVLARCGDGVVDPGEACDDGNLVPADGCSPDCVQSGTPIWERIEGDPFGADDAALDVAVLAPDDVVVAGQRQPGPDGHVAVYGRYRGDDGETVWTQTHDTAAASDIAEAIVVNGSNDIIVGGTSGTLTATASSWVSLVEPNGRTTWSVVPDLVALQDLAANGGGAIVVGRGVVEAPNVQGAVALAVNEDTGAQLWRRTFAEGSSFDAVARFAQDQAFYAAAIGDDVALVRGGATGLEEIDRLAHPFGGIDRVQGLALFGGTRAVALGGFVNTEAGPDWWVRVYDGGTEERWTRTDTELPLSLSDEVEDLVFTPDGSVVVLGLVTREDKDIWVARFDPEGELVWEQILPDDNAGDDVGRGLALGVDGSLLAVGERSLQAGDRDAWVAKLVP